MATLPFLTARHPSIGGRMRTSPEDFRVEEIPAYLPSGEGEHLYVTFEKRGITTPDAVRAVARALGADPRNAGWAGLKDRDAVTVQTASFQGADEKRLDALDVPGVRVLSAKRHRNKLKSGHLHGNRFTLVIRGCDDGAFEVARTVAAEMLETGVPNYYGAQRFGRDGDNAERARSWLSGETPAPREPFLRKMLVSSLQSALFNRYVAQRLEDGLLAAYVPGDLAVRHPVGGPFPIDPAEAMEAYPARRCSPTGPMFGRSMRWPEGVAREREQAVLDASGITLEYFAKARDLAEGTRRSVRMCPEQIDVLRLEGDGPGVDLALSFALPAGGYATAVLREFRKSDDEGLQSGPASGIETAATDAPAEGEERADG